MNNDKNISQRMGVQEGITFIVQAINRALVALKVESSTVGDANIRTSAEDLWNIQIKFLLEQSGHLSRDSSVFDFPEKALANLEWLKPYGVTGADWAATAIKRPSLFCQKPETLQTNFEANLEWLKSYGVTGADWAAAAVKYPQLLYQKPETLQTNFEANLEWLKPFGVTGADWASAAINRPPLFSQKPETLQTNFEANLEWLKPFGVTGADWAAAAIKQPSLFYQKPERLRTNFELLMVVCEMPAFKARKNDLTFREINVAWALSHPSVLCLAEDNFLLRLAYAEVTQPKPSAALLNDTRGKLEKKLVQALGHDPATKVVSIADGGNTNAQIGKATAKHLKSEFKAYADLLRSDWRSRPVATEPRTPEISITSVMLPMQGGALKPEEKKVLLKRMILGGLLKGYKLAA